MVYSNNRQAVRKLRRELLSIQQGFGAYSENKFELDKSFEVEHFDPLLKGTDQDNGFNYYAELAKVNKCKPNALVKGERNNPNFPHQAQFFTSKFYQNRDDRNKCIAYDSKTHIYYATENVEDTEQFLEFIQVNQYFLSTLRKKYINRIKDVFQPQADGTYDMDTIISYFNDRPDDLEYISVLEVELGITIDLNTMDGFASYLREKMDELEKSDEEKYIQRLT